MAEVPDANPEHKRVLFCVFFRLYVSARARGSPVKARGRGRISSADFGESRQPVGMLHHMRDKRVNTHMLGGEVSVDTFRGWSNLSQPFPPCTRSQQGKQIAWAKVSWERSVFETFALLFIMIPKTIQV